MTLTIHQITKSYGANLALDRFTAELTPGIYALLGPNGSGKSTLMNILTDNLKADSGSIAYTSDDGVTEDVLLLHQQTKVQFWVLGSSSLIFW